MSMTRCMTGVVTVFLSACGSSDGQPNVTVSLSASPLTIVAGNAVTLNWSSTNATGCSASGGWSGSKSADAEQPVALEPLSIRSVAVERARPMAARSALRCCLFSSSLAPIVRSPLLKTRPRLGPSICFPQTATHWNRSFTRSALKPQMTLFKK